MTRAARWLVIAQAADALTFAAFYLAVGPGRYTERNPIVLALFAAGGIALVVIVKVGLAVLLAWRHDRTTITHPRAVAVAMALAACSGIVGAGFNLAATVRSIGGT